MIKVLMFDNLGNYVGEKLEDKDNYKPTENEFVQNVDEGFSFYEPRLVNGEVVEGLSKDEIESIKNKPSQKGDIQMLREENAMFMMQLAETQFENKRIVSDQATLIMELMIKGVI